MPLTLLTMRVATRLRNSGGKAQMRAAICRSLSFLYAEAKELQQQLVRVFRPESNFSVEFLLCLTHVGEHDLPGGGAGADRLHKRTVAARAKGISISAGRTNVEDEVLDAITT